MNVYVFVYGTLRKGQYNHRLLSGALFLGQHKIQGYDMFDSGHFPMVRPGQGTVSGEVFQISPAQLSVLDELEGHPHFFNRQQIKTPWGNTWIYLYMRAHNDCPKVLAGDWLEHRNGTRHSKTMLYFAYGSNMLTERLQRRVPSAKPIGAAHVYGHQLKFHKIGRDGSGKGDLFQTHESKDISHGVLFEFAIADVNNLHEAEGLGYGYNSKQIVVHTQTGQHQAMTYFATKIQSGLQPFDWYLGLVVSGAFEHGLPQHYIEQLQNVHAPRDPDPERRAHHREIILNGGGYLAPEE